MRVGEEGPEQDREPPQFSSAAIATFGNQLVTACLSFFNVLIVARTIGPTGRGEIAFLMTIALMTSTVGLLGVDEANVNFAGRQPELRRSLATNSLFLSMTFGIVCVGILALLMTLFPGLVGDVPPGLRWLALASVPILVLKVFLKFLVQADYHFGVANASWLLPPLFSVAVNLVLAGLGLLTVTSAFVTWAVAHALATLLLVAFVAFRSVGFGRPDAALARRTFKFGFKSHLGRLMLVGNYRLDQWFVGAIAGSRELGLYSIAVTWAEILFYLPTALVIAQRPYLVRASKEDAGRRAAQVFRITTILTTALTLGVIVAAPIMCVTVFGDDFRGSIDDLRMLAPGALGVVALKLCGNAMTAHGRPLRATAGATAAFVVMVLLDVVLVSPFGGFGAATASTIAYLFGGVVTGVLFLRFFDVAARALIPRPAELTRLARAAGPPLLNFWRSRIGHR